MTLRKYSSALPAAVLAAALALAGCGSTSSSGANTNGNGGTGEPPTPTKTPLQKAKDGAMTASQMAQQQSEEAGSKADEADDALEGIVLLRTGYQGGEHAMKARQAADAARTAYDTAQAEAGKATGTDSLRVATLAKMAAEKALETAKAQAALAVAEANKATEAAGNGMHLMHVEGRTYKRGDTTITAGPGNNRSTVRNLLTGTKVIATTATEKVIAAREGNSLQGVDFLQSEVTSADGSARLTLISKYAAPKKTNVFHPLGGSDFAGNSAVGISTTITEETPYGFLTDRGSIYKIERESGEFYQVSVLPHTTFGSGRGGLRRWPRLSASNVSSLKVNANAKDVNADEYTGIYYLIPTAQVTIRSTGLVLAPNQKVYLQRG